MIVMLMGAVFFIIGIAGLVFWIMMLVDCIKRNFEKPNEKIIWLLVIIFCSILGAVIYWFVVKNKR